MLTAGLGRRTRSRGGDRAEGGRADERRGGHRVEALEGRPRGSTRAAECVSPRNPTRSHPSWHSRGTTTSPEDKLLDAAEFPGRGRGVALARALREHGGRGVRPRGRDDRRQRRRASSRADPRGGGGRRGPLSRGGRAQPAEGAAASLAASGGGRMRLPVPRPGDDVPQAGSCRARECRRARRLLVTSLDPEAADAALAPGETRVEHHSSGRGVEVTLKSQFGLARRRHHPDPVALADAILEAADPIAMSSSSQTSAWTPVTTPPDATAASSACSPRDSSPSARPEASSSAARAVGCSRAIRVCASTDRSNTETLTKIPRVRWRRAGWRSHSSAPGRSRAVGSVRTARLRLRPLLRFRFRPSLQPPLRETATRSTRDSKRRATAISRRFVFSSRRRGGTPLG